MNEQQSIGSRIGDFAYLAAVCFLAYIKILTNWQVMSLMGGYAAARYAVKAIKENKNSVKEIITTAVNAATNVSGTMQANPNSIRPGPYNPPPDDPSSKITREIPEQRGSHHPIVPRMDPPTDKRFKRMALEYFPTLFPIAFVVMATLFLSMVTKDVAASIFR